MKFKRIAVLKGGWSPERDLGGRHALEVVQSLSLDIVFMDIHMPHMDGLTTARAILSLPLRTRVCSPGSRLSSASTLSDSVAPCEMNTSAG